MTSRRAVIDIGTNSVKLLVGDVAPDGTVCPVHESSEQTRLGTGFYATRILQPQPIRHTAEAAARFAATARDLGAPTPRTIATSAARDAHNAADLVHALRDLAALPLQVLSGDQEAEWVCRGVQTDPALAPHPIVIIDAGGGSTEFVIACDGHLRFRQSFNLGTVRWLEHHALHDPPTPDDLSGAIQELAAFFRDSVLPELQPHLRAAAGCLCVGASGTATILARLHHQLDTYDRKTLDGTVLSAAAVTSLRQRLWQMPLAERRRVPGLPPERADVILPGIAIYEAALHHLQLPELHITLRGLRYAALLDPN